MTTSQARPSFVKMFVITDHPSDYPSNFVVREHVIAAGVGIGVAPPYVVCNSLEDARAAIPRGLIRIPRAPSDDAVIVETWI